MKRKFNLGLGLFLLFIFFTVINSLFFLVKYIMLEMEAEQYIQEEVYVEKEVKATQNVAIVVTPSVVPVKKSKNKGKPKKIAIVINDLGARTVRYYLLDLMENKLNLAIIPGEMHSVDMIKFYKMKSNYELIMHMPMGFYNTDEDKESPGHKREAYKYFIQNRDNKKTINKKLDDAYNVLLAAGGVVGINNHMGSYVTSSRDMVNPIVKWAKRKQLYVLDSLSAPSSLLYEQARKTKVKAAYNQVFLDSIDDPEEIKKQLAQVEKIADSDGQVIAIGHIGKQYTMEVLFEWMPQAVERGYTFVFVSELVQ